MRLIDADALKEQIAKTVEEEGKIDKKWSKGLNYALKIIDNATTVEPCYQTTSCLDCKMYDKEKYNCPRFCEVIRSAIEERQQGEWIEVKKGKVYRNEYCSRAGKCIDYIGWHCAGCSDANEGK